jgi:hypothetical protein
MEMPNIRCFRYAGRLALYQGTTFSRVPMSLRLTQGDENQIEVVFDCAVKA